MSATEEQPVTKPDETKPVEAVAATETSAEDTTNTAPAPTEATPEMTVLSKDPEVVKSDLTTAEPVAADAIESTDAAPAETTTEETPAEPTPAAPEKPKEGSSLLGFIKKHVPNPKVLEKKSPSKAAAEAPTKPESETAAVATTSAPVEEVVDDKPFDGDTVDFKTHGGFFGCDSFIS
jgi:hypothetical protein